MESIDQGVGFDDTFTSDNHILFIVLTANRMIGWMVRNFISKEENAVLKIYEAQRPHV